MSFGTLTAGLGSVAAGYASLSSGFGIVTSGFQGGSGGEAPTTPLARQTWAAGWRLSAQDSPWFMPSGQRRVMRARVTNLTGQTIQALALDMIQAVGSDQTYDISVGPWTGSGLNASSWTNSTAVIPAATNGTVEPGCIRKTISLPSPVANGGQFIISVRPPSSQCITHINFNADAWPATGFIEEAAVSTSDVAVNASWPGSIDGVFGVIASIEFLSLTGDPEIQICHVGDSVGEMEPFNGNGEWFIREGWCIQGNLAESAGRFRWASIGNGTYSMDDYLARVSHLITTSWIDSVDVVSLQVWTPNQAPSDVAGAQAQWAQIEAVASAIRAAGRGVIFTLLTPPSSDKQGAGEVSAWEWTKARIASEAHVYLDDIVADTPTTILAAASGDLKHINMTYQTLQGAALPARTATALAVLGYSV